MQQPLDVVVVAEEDDVQAFGGVLKHQPPMESGAAFISMMTQFADTQPDVQVGQAEFIGQATQSQGALVPLGLFERVDFRLNMMGDNDGVLHGVISAVRG